MSKRTCSACVYAIQPTKGQWLKAMMSRWPCGLTCLNHADCPGVLRHTWPGNTCRNFRAEGERQARADAGNPIGTPLLFRQPIREGNRHSTVSKKGHQPAMLEKLAWARSAKAAWCSREPQSTM